MEKTVDMLIAETEQRIVEAINESHLHPAVISLILRNILAQMQSLSIQMDKGADHADSKP